MSDLTVPPLPVVAWSHSGDWTDDHNEAEFWKADPMRRGIVEYVRKADAKAVIASLQARLDVAERQAVRLTRVQDFTARLDAIEIAARESRKAWIKSLHGESSE